MENFSFSLFQDPNYMSDGSTAVVVDFGRTGGETELRVDCAHPTIEGLH
ncbi:hypothetical protein DSM14862_04076 (plasmid) [Sulfitobacter indolifex]|nr:hypothetical protein DSM14862_04076 [Sulfitobacter indolifex]